MTDLEYHVRAKQLVKCHRAGQRFAKTDRARDMDGDQINAEAIRRYADDRDARSLFVSGMYDFWRVESAPVYDT